MVVGHRAGLEPAPTVRSGDKLSPCPFHRVGTDLCAGPGSVSQRAHTQVRPYPYHSVPSGFLTRAGEPGPTKTVG